MAELVSLLFFILYTRSRIDCCKYGLDRIPKFRLDVLKRMLNVSFWTMIQNFFSLSTWFLFFLYVEHLGERYPELSGYYPKPKALLVPWILSVQQLTGIYSPFTVEANYNSGMADYNIPFTACHELSHLRGFMQEEEANFIAFLASTGSENIDFQYSGYLMGWRYCMNVLYQVDYESWEEIRGKLSERVEPDFIANRDFWDRYDGRIARAANKVNDTYLKANDQSEGVESYNRMVDLIVAYKRVPD